MSHCEQLTLLEPSVAPTRASERARALRDAQQRAEVGMAQSESSADWALPGWCAKATEKLRMFARAQGGVFTIELARDALRDELSMPPDLRAFGKVTVMALKAGYIERVPRAFMPAASSNSAPKAVYRKGPKA